MIFLALRIGLGLLGVAAVAVGALDLRTPSIVPAPIDAAVTPATVPGSSRSEGSGRLVRLAEGTTPFRPDHQVPKVRFGEAPLAPPAPPVLKPVLLLSGIVWGAVPAAILEGFPGREGQVVLREGESEGVFRVRRIERGVVEISGLDTTWILQVREPWK